MELPDHLWEKIISLTTIDGRRAANINRKIDRACRRELRSTIRHLQRNVVDTDVAGHESQLSVRGRVLPLDNEKRQAAKRKEICLHTAIQQLLYSRRQRLSRVRTHRHMRFDRARAGHVRGRKMDPLHISVSGHKRARRIHRRTLVVQLG